MNSFFLFFQETKIKNKQDSSVSNATASTKESNTSSAVQKDPEKDFSWWRGSSQLASLFQLIFDVSNSKDVKYLKKNLLPKLLRWGTKSFLALSDSILKKEDIDTVHTMLRNCELACESHEQVVLPGSTIVLNNQNDQKEEEEGKYSSEGVSIA